MEHQTTRVSSLQMNQPTDKYDLVETDESLIVMVDSLSLDRNIKSNVDAANSPKTMIDQETNKPILMKDAQSSIVTLDMITQSGEKNDLEDYSQLHIRKKQQPHQQRLTIETTRHGDHNMGFSSSSSSVFTSNNDTTSSFIGICMIGCFSIGLLMFRFKGGRLPLLKKNKSKKQPIGLEVKDNNDNINSSNTTNTNSWMRLISAACTTTTITATSKNTEECSEDTTSSSSNDDEHYMNQENQYDTDDMIETKSGMVTTAIPSQRLKIYKEDEVVVYLNKVYVPHEKKDPEQEQDNETRKLDSSSPPIQKQTVKSIILNQLSDSFLSKKANNKDKNNDDEEESENGWSDNDDDVTTVVVIDDSWYIDIELPALLHSNQQKILSLMDDTTIADNNHNNDNNSNYIVNDDKNNVVSNERLFQKKQRILDHPTVKATTNNNNNNNNPITEYNCERNVVVKEGTETKYNKARIQNQINKMKLIQQAQQEPKKSNNSLDDINTSNHSTSHTVFDDETNRSFLSLINTKTQQQLRIMILNNSTIMNHNSDNSLDLNDVFSMKKVRSSTHNNVQQQQPYNNIRHDNNNADNSNQSKKMMMIGGIAYNSNDIERAWIEVEYSQHIQDDNRISQVNDLHNNSSLSCCNSKGSSPIRRGTIRKTIHNADNKYKSCFYQNNNHNKFDNDIVDFGIQHVTTSTTKDESNSRLEI